MPSVLFDITSLLPLIDDGATILTPNKRLCSHIRQAYCDHANAFVAAPNVFSLGEWLQQQWQRILYGDFDEQRILINDAQRLWNWQQVINEADTPYLTLSQQKLAKLADEAYRQLILWQVPVAELQIHAGQFIETQQLLEWIKKFESHLQQRQLITVEQAIEKLHAICADNGLPKIKQIHLQNFDDLPPLTEKLLENASNTLSDDKAQQTESNSIQVNGKIRRTAAATPDEEILSAAQWCWQILQNNPQATIGIIVPDLSARRQRIEQLFVEVFEAHYLMPATPRYPLPINISTGVPLGQTPLINDALQLLKLNLENISLQQACELLYSPFYSDLESELELRAALVEQLRSLQVNQLRIAQIRNEAQWLIDKNSSSAAQNTVHQHFIDRLQQFATVSRQHRHRPYNAQRWSEIFQRQLSVLGWPGVRPLDSVEYQQATHWQQLLETFNGIDALQSQLSLSDALELLQQLANNTHFQAQVKASPIHILGTLEAAGLQFSHCWLLGFDNHHWPPSPNPNPLLPPQLQRQYQMPRASIDRELRYAHTLTRDFLSCAQDIVFSYAEQDDDNIHAPSPLIETIDFEALKQIFSGFNRENDCALERQSALLQQTQQLELLDCLYGPPLTVNELAVKENTSKTDDVEIEADSLETGKEAVKGGSGILQLQAGCPFNAFARKRLGALGSESPSLGLTPIQRGNLLHTSLAIIWRQLQSRQRLLQLSINELENCISDAVAMAFTQELRHNAFELGNKYLDVEQQRLKKLIAIWLQLEKQRPEFKINAIERDYVGRFDGIDYRLRVDRVDELADGKLLIIDYKSGTTSLNSWFSERPRQPQLPLYAITYSQQETNKEVVAIAFAEINAKSQRLLGVGLSPEVEDIDGIQDVTKIIVKYFPEEIEQQNFLGLQQLLAEKLKILSREYQTGFAAVQFNQASDIQRIDADLLPLNRYQEIDFINSYLETALETVLEVSESHSTES